MRLALAFAASLAAGPALADYSDHAGVRLFTQDPCRSAVAAVDYDGTALMAIAEKGMAWGFILGFDTAHGGLEGGEESTLVRLRKACAENPEATAIDLMRGFK